MYPEVNTNTQNREKLEAMKKIRVDVRKENSYESILGDLGKKKGKLILLKVKKIDVTTFLNKMQMILILKVEEIDKKLILGVELSREGTREMKFLCMAVLL